MNFEKYLYKNKSEENVSFSYLVIKYLNFSIHHFIFLNHFTKHFINNCASDLFFKNI